MTPTDFDTLDAITPLSAEDLPRQWLLTRDPAAIPKGWRQGHLQGWWFGSHPDARLCELTSSGGTLIGWAVDALAYLQADRADAPGEVLPLPLEPACNAAAVEAALYGRGADGWSSGDGLQGMWTAVVLTPDLQRLYVSPTHSVVYAAETRQAATSHNLLGKVARDLEVSRAFDPLATNRFYTFGLTPFVGVRRLLPNHYLDLRTFKSVRHWPIQGFAPRSDESSPAALVVDHSRRVLAAMQTKYSRLHVSLSAGRDSRAMLALLRTLKKTTALDISTFTTGGRSTEARTDMQIARRMAKIAGFHHEVRPNPSRTASLEAVRRSFVRIGEAKAGKILHAAAQPEARSVEGLIHLAGMGGETARAFYWADAAATHDQVKAEVLAARLGSPALPAVLEAAREWIEALPAAVRARPCDVLDLMYVEQRLGGWQAPARYLFPGRGGASLNPMTSALAIETMLRLPEDYRRAGLMQRDMVAYGWPELLALPFNEPVGLLRARKFAGDLRRSVRARGRGMAAPAKRVPALAAQGPS